MEDDDISQELYTRNKVDASNTASEKKRNLYDAIGVEVDVKNLNYSVIVNKQTRKLLRDISFGAWGNVRSDGSVWGWKEVN